MFSIFIFCQKLERASGAAWLHFSVFLNPGLSLSRLQGDKWLLISQSLVHSLELKSFVFQMNESLPGDSDALKLCALTVILYFTRQNWQIFL